MGDIKALFEEAGFNLSPEQERDFSAYLEEIKKWNRVHNLTAVREDTEIVKRHFIDSLFLAKAFEEIGIDWRGKSIADVGSGAGFPGVPLKIYLRDVELYLIESSSKRCAFLENLKLKLSVSYEVLCERAENLKKNFDIVVARALGEFEKIAPMLESLSSRYIFVMKGREISDVWTEKLGYRAYRVNSPFYGESYILWKKKG